MNFVNFKKNKKIIIFILSVFIIFLAFFVFTYCPSCVNQKEINNSEIEKDNFSEMADIALSIYNHKIEPSSFTVKAGQDVKLKIVSMEGSHSFAFEDENLSWVGGDFKEIGQTLDITFTAPREKGSYLFYCAKDSHREKGEMVVE